MFSDDFDTVATDPRWRFEGAVGTFVLGQSSTDAYLELSIPSGGDYDAWAENTAMRVMQDAADSDLIASTGFLSVPTQKYQIQGLLFEEDADDYIRFDVYSSGNKLHAFAAVTEDGVSSTRLHARIDADEAAHLRVERAGDAWSFLSSADGMTWSVLGSFTQDIALSAAGVFAGSSDDDLVGPGYVARVDYFEVSGDPIVDEDGNLDAPPPGNAPPVAVDDAFNTPAGTARVLDVGGDLLGNDSDGDDDPLSVTGYGTPLHGTLGASSDGTTLTYTPDPGHAGPDSFTYTITDGTDIDTATVTVTTEADDPPPGSFASDDFNTPALGPIWRIEGPAGTASLGQSSTDAYLELSIPSGGDYDAWAENTAMRVMQDAADSDLIASTGFLSVPTQKYQIQGLLFEEDADDYIRFDVYSSGNKLHAFAAVTEDGVSSTRLHARIDADEAAHLRVERAGDAWSFLSSADGMTWSVLGSFTQDIALSAAGVFAGSSDDDLVGPGYVARVDYFEVSGDPIVDEDGNLDAPPPGNAPPVAVDDAFNTPAGTARVLDVGGDLLGNDSDGDDDPLSVTGYGTPLHGTLGASSDGTTLTYTPDPGHAGPDSFTYTITDGTDIDTATVTVTTAGPTGTGDRIDVWYGNEQRIGNPGETQIWANIFGRVDTMGLAALEYAQNAGAFTTLTLGPDTRRLQNEGDFNIDVLFDGLDPTATDDLFTIRATYLDGSVEEEVVMVEYEAGNVWAPDYAIDWSGVANLTDAVQVIDGYWAHTSDGLRPVDIGYDRLVGIGDQNWDNYEVALSFTGHDLTTVDPLGRDGGGFGFHMLWNGHSDDPIAGWDPKVGWEGVGSFWYAQDQLYIERYEGSSTLDSAPFSISEGVTYNATIRVEQVGALDRGYKLKIWEEGTAEPLGWALEAVEEFDAPVTGSFLINAHYHDLTFGDIAVTEIRGSDIEHGTDGNDSMVLADLGNPNPGSGEIDVFIGGSGADEFVFGENGVAYYDDGILEDEGNDDYGLIWDLDPFVDTIRLAGAASDYELWGTYGDMPEGTTLYLYDPVEGYELVGIMAGVTGLDLRDDVFVFDPLIA